MIHNIILSNNTIECCSKNLLLIHKININAIIKNKIDLINYYIKLIVLQKYAYNVLIKLLLLLVGIDHAKNIKMERTLESVFNYIKNKFIILFYC